MHDSDDHAPGLDRAFDLDVVESDDTDLRVDGEIPHWLRGSYYLNGPCRFRRGDLAYRHWLDGDGMVSRLAFADGGARLTNRFVRSRKWLDEEAAGAPRYRAFGTHFEGDELLRGVALMTPANVSVWRWRDTLLAFGEQGLPFELDPATLETHGTHTFDGRLNEVSPISAHPSIDPVSGEMFNFGISFAKKAPSLTLYRWSPDGELARRTRLRIPHPVSVHDFVLGPEHVFFYLSPHVLDVDVLLGEGKSVMDALVWRPELGSRLLVASRQTGEVEAEIELAAGDAARYCLHLANAWQCTDPRHGERLVLDLIELDRPVYDQYQVIPDLFTDEPQGRLARYVLDPSSWRVLAHHDHPYTASMDFPAIDPRRAQMPTRHTWVLSMSASGRPGRKFFDQVVRIDLGASSGEHRSDQDLSDQDLSDEHLESGFGDGGHEQWTAPAGTYLGGEPVFLPNPLDAGREKGAGCVLCQSLDTSSSQPRGAFLLFDAHHLAQGPIATLHLEHPIPLCFHASFQPEAAP